MLRFFPGLILYKSHTCSPSCCEFMCATAPSCSIKYCFASGPLPWLLQAFCHCDPWALGKGGCHRDVPFKTENSVVPYSWYVDQLWASVLVAIYCKKKLLLMGKHPAWVCVLTVIQTFANESLPPNYRALGAAWQWICLNGSAKPC